MTSLQLPTNPCDCLTVNPFAFGCIILVALVWFRREKRKLILHQLLNPRDGNPQARLVADAVLLCDTTKLFLGFIVAHAMLFVHEAVISNGGRDETRFYFVMHLVRSFICVACMSFIGNFLWRFVVRQANYLSSQGNETVLVQALRASGRYNPSFNLHWDEESSLDFRIDQDHPVVAEPAPSTFEQRAAQHALQIQSTTSDSHEDENEDDETNERAALRRRSSGDRNVFEPMPTWWWYQTGCWCLILFTLCFIVVVIDIFWRVLLGHHDPILFVIESIIDASDDSGDFVCTGIKDGAWLSQVSGQLPHWGIVLLEWLVLALWHILMDTGLFVFLYAQQKYRGRTVHPVLEAQH